jgi:hypothetical protein
LAPWIRNRIQVEIKSWIRIRIETYADSQHWFHKWASNVNNNLCVLRLSAGTVRYAVLPYRFGSAPFSEAVVLDSRLNRSEKPDSYRICTFEVKSGNRILKEKRERRRLTMEGIVGHGQCADSYHFDEERDPDSLQSKSDPDPHP